jgi:hypothetical protein
MWCQKLPGLVPSNPGSPLTQKSSHSSQCDKSEGRLLEKTPHPWVGGGQSRASLGCPPSKTLTKKNLSQACTPDNCVQTVEKNIEEEEVVALNVALVHRCVSAKVVLVSLSTKLLCDLVLVSLCPRNIFRRCYSSSSTMCKVSSGMSVKALPAMFTKLNFRFMFRDMLCA